MSDYDYGPLQEWEIIWRTGHVEHVQGHQIQMESGGFVRRENPRLIIHGRFGKYWRLVLCVPEEDILSVRLTGDAQVSQETIS